MRRSAMIIFAVAMFCGTYSLRAQSAAPPSFDAASIKQNQTATLGGGVDMSGTRLVARNMTVEQLVRAAYADPSHWLPNSSLLNEPSWMKQDTFDVVATTGAGVSPGESEQKRLMLQTLLADRFHLALHTEKRDSPRYALTFARSDRRLGPTLHVATSRCDRDVMCALRIGLGPVGLLSGQGQPLSVIINAFSRLVDALIVDQTGLDGVFDVDLRFNGDALMALRLPAGIARPPDATSDAPSFFTAVQEQLGLKLEPGRGPVDVIVIDHVEHPTGD